VLVTPALLTGPAAARRLSRVNAASSAAGVAAPLALGALDGAAGRGRLVLLAAVPVLLLLALSARPAATAAAGSASAAAAPRAVGERWLRVVLAVAVEFCFVVWAVTRLQATGLGPAAATLWGTAFPLGMALGRLAGPVLLGRAHVVPLAAAVSAAGAVAVAVATGSAGVAGGLAVAGLGVAVLYPVTLADLAQTPGLPPARGAALGALASGVAILLAPPALAVLGNEVGLRAAFLACVPLLGALVALRPDRERTSPTRLRPRAQLSARLGR
jgi:hypothetical protein